jgi:hypothetical protein
MPFVDLAVVPVPVLVLLHEFHARTLTIEAKTCKVVFAISRASGLPIIVPVPGGVTVRVQVGVTVRVPVGVAVGVPARVTVPVNPVIVVDTVSTVRGTT